MEVPIDILHRYLERRLKDLENCSQWVRDKNFVNLEKVGHQLKGNGSTFGFEELSRIGVIMEDAAKRKDLPELENVVRYFNAWINQNLS